MKGGGTSVFWTTCAAVFLADLLTKSLVRARLPVHSSIELISFFSVTHTQNKGSVFGLLGNYDVNLLFLLITAAAVVCIFYYASRTKLARCEYLVWGVIAGGALGNLLDRILYGAVTDFLDFKVWPVFNVGDAAITVGILLLVWKEIKRTPRK